MRRSKRLVYTGRDTRVKVAKQVTRRFHGAADSQNVGIIPAFGNLTATHALLFPRLRHFFRGEQSIRQQLPKGPHMPILGPTREDSTSTLLRTE
jgi:hypothetical protein